MDNARRASGLFQHLLDWSRILSFLPHSQLAKILPLVTQLANALMDMAPSQQLRRQEEPLQKTPTLATESVLVTVPIHGWAKLQTLQHLNRKKRTEEIDAARRAEELLHRLEEIYNLTGNTRYQPLSESYGGVLDAWSKSPLEDAPQRAAALLERMSSDSNPLAKPDTRAYNFVLNAWATRGNPDKAMELFQEMQDCEIPLDKYTYSIVTKAWLRSRRPDAARNVQQLLRQCIHRYKSDPKHNPMPISMQFGTLIKLYDREPHRGQEVLDEMLKWYEREKRHVDLQPQTRHFIPLMNAWARRGEAEKVENLLVQLQQLYEAGNGKCKPNHKV